VVAMRLLVLEKETSISQSWDPPLLWVAVSPKVRASLGCDGLCCGNGMGMDLDSRSKAFSRLSAVFRFISGILEANFFDGKHYVIKGGSARTAACMLTSFVFANYWFPASLPVRLRGVRCVSN